MRPFFKWYGGKWRLAGAADPPRFPLIVEPFAGGAGYSVRYGRGRRVRLIDAAQDVVDMWSWLLGASQADVLALPVEPLQHGADVRELGLDRAPMLLIRSWLTTQGSRSNWRMTPMCMGAVDALPGAVWSERVRARIAAQLPGIARWTVELGSYADVEPGCATWHVDPPYQHNTAATSTYGTGTDYAHLADWCRRLTGQVMVHEQHGADWLPFETFVRDAKTGNTKAGQPQQRQHEVIWNNGAAQMRLGMGQ